MTSACATSAAAVLAILAATTTACDRADGCADCRVVLDSVVTLGEAEGDGALPGVPIVSPRFRDGSYLVTAPWGATDELVRVYDSAGRFIRLLGRGGGGPNEYRRPEFVHRVGDTAFIHDPSLARFTLLVPPDSTGLVRPWPLRPYTFLPLADGTYALTTGSWEPGRLMRHVDPAGRVLRRFGDSLPPGQPGFQIALLAADAGSGFWSALSARRLSFQHWTTPGETDRSLDLTRDWYPPYTEYVAPTPERAPSPSLIGFWAGSAGTLWLVAQVPDARWVQGLGPAKESEGHTYYPVSDPDLIFDTIIEQVDVATGVALVHARVDRTTLQVVEPWVLSSARQTVEGWYRVTLWRVRPN